MRFASRPKGSKPFLTPGAYSEIAEAGTKTISGNGRYAVLSLYSERLGTGDALSVYRRDLLTGKLELASRKSGKKGSRAEYAAQGSISDDGTRVAFRTFTSLVAADTEGRATYTSGTSRPTRRPWCRGPTGRVATWPIADIDSSQISGNGKRVVFETEATNLGVPGGQFPGLRA